MISIVIPTYYRYDRISKIISLIKEQSHPPDEIIIVDQTPLCDRPLGFYEQFIDTLSIELKIINLDTPSLSASRNIGAQQAAGDFLLFLDDDMEFGQDLVKNHLHVMRREVVDVVYGAISTTACLPERDERDTINFDPLSFFLKSPNIKWEGMALVISGANTLIKKDFFLKAGCFDEKIPRMEDIELGYRLFRTGAKIYYSFLPHAIHNAAPSGGTRTTQKNIKYVRLLSKVYLYKKHFNGWALQQFYLFVLKNGFTYRDLLSGVFYLSHLRNPLWPIQAIYMLYSANRQANFLLLKDKE